MDKTLAARLKVGAAGWLPAATAKASQRIQPDRLFVLSL